MRFVKLSATTSGVADVKEAIKIAKNEQSLFKRKTVLFIDEIHRFNKMQQVCNDISINDNLMMIPIFPIRVLFMSVFPRSIKYILGYISSAC